MELERLEHQKASLILDIERLEEDQSIIVQQRDNLVVENATLLKENNELRLELAEVRDGLETHIAPTSHREYSSPGKPLVEELN